MSVTDGRPSITIVVPTLNEARDIGTALQSIVSNEIPISHMEVLVIDGGSKDGTGQIAEGFRDRLQLRVINAPGSSVYRALNIGLEAARGEFFVRVDARSKIPSNYIERCVHNLDDQAAQCVGGVQLQFGNSLVGASIARVTSSVIGTGGAKFRTGTASGFVDSVYLGVYRTVTLRNLGGFDDQSSYVSEDALINKRIRECGGRVYLDAGLHVLYPAKASFRALAKQYVIYGAAKAFVVLKYRTLTSFRQALPLVFLTTWLGLFTLCLVGLVPWSFLGAVLLFYLVVVVLANVGSSTGLGDQHPGTLIGRTIATMCIHFAYPIGFFMFLLSPRLHKRLATWL